jgi:hypothetical protein
MNSIFRFSLGALRTSQAQSGCAVTKKSPFGRMTLANEYVSVSYIVHYARKSPTVYGKIWNQEIHRRSDSKV